MEAHSDEKEGLSHEIFKLSLKVSTLATAMTATKFLFLSGLLLIPVNLICSKRFLDTKRELNMTKNLKYDGKSYLTV